MTDEEHKWIETNNSVCALLRQAHDVLAISSLPPKRTWVGLTDEETRGCVEATIEITDPLLLDAVNAVIVDVERLLREKNT
jgi:hypothetical protein